MTCANVNKVDDWIKQRCTEVASKADTTFYSSLFDNFYSQSVGGIWAPGVNDPPSSDALNFQYLLIDLCNQVGKGMCKEPLEKICSVYERKDTNHPIIRQVCGCYLPSNQYKSTLPRACDTVCSGFDTAKYFSSTQSLDPETCDTNVCIIDNVTITATSSEVGDITFDQICPFCAGIAGCRCIISDINIISRNSQMGKLNINQNCGDNVQCFASPPGRGQVEVPCAKYVDSFGLDVSEIEREREQTTIYIATYIVLAIIILIILVISIIISYREVRVGKF